jgi:hypothetical protein
MTKIVDFFTFYAPTCKEMLELRYHLFKDYVDEFVICESNKTQSGIKINYELKNILKELNIPKDKIKIIELNIPDENDIFPEEIDRINCYDGNYSNINSLKSRVRERLQKDSLLTVINDYDDETIFIHSDIDEMINPLHLSWIIPIIKNIKNKVIRIPLVHLEGRADLRVYLKDTNQPKPWSGMFICTKEHLKTTTPTQIRSNALNPYPISFLTQDNEIIEDLGWHFSWMGTKEKRIEKSKAFTHYDDTFSFLSSKKYNSQETENFLSNIEFKEGSISPSGDKNTFLKKYSIKELPPKIFELHRVKNLLLPEIKFNPHINNQHRSTSWIVDNFYENPDSIREFALEQDYLEGGLGRGFIGRRTEQQFLFSGLREKFEDIMGRKITKWEEHGMNGRFQISWSGEPLVYHCDSQKWGGMLYLTPGAPYQCGTTLYAHKQTRARTYHDEGWNASWENVPGDCHLDGTPFEPVDVLGNVYNRLVIFDASAIHSASQYFGTVKENARLWQMFFFDTE